MFLIHIPLRIKISILIAGALFISLFSILYFGRSLIIRDKSSYIYDYNLSQTQTHLHQFNEIRVLKQKEVTELIIIPDETEKKQFFTNKLNQSILSLLLLKKDKESFSFESFFGQDEENFKKWIHNHNLSEQDFLSQKIIGYKKIILLGYVHKNINEKIFFAYALNPELLKIKKSNLDFYLFNSEGYPFLNNHDDLKEHVSEIFQQKFDSGVKDTYHQKKHWILAYQKIPNSNLILLSLMDRNIAFSAAELLIKQSLILGFTIFCLALAITLLFSRSLTKRLREMWKATQEVTRGNFSIRVQETRSRDEIGGLSRSFNLMSEKIKDLLLQTAEKARMEKELETAQLVQSRYFPEKNFIHAEVSIAGKCHPASECGGDWWNYAHFGDEIILALGDVTGHGVSSALVTAAVHCTFKQVMLEFETKERSLSELIEKLNLAVKTAAGGTATMTFIAGLIHLKNKTIKIVNASHRKPYLISKKTNKVTIQPLVSPPGDQLGLSSTLKIPETIFDITHDDLLFFYTDGVIECENDVGKVLRPRELSKLLESIYNNTHSAEDASQQLFSSLMTFFGSRAQKLDDDVTFSIVRFSEAA